MLPNFAVPIAAESKKSCGFLPVLPILIIMQDLDCSSLPPPPLKPAAAADDHPRGRVEGRGGRGSGDHESQGALHRHC